MRRTICRWCRVSVVRLRVTRGALAGNIIACGEHHGRIVSGSFETQAREILGVADLVERMSELVVCVSRETPVWPGIACSAARRASACCKIAGAVRRCRVPVIPSHCTRPHPLAKCEKRAEVHALLTHWHSHARTGFSLRQHKLQRHQPPQNATWQRVITTTCYVVA